MSGLANHYRQRAVALCAAQHDAAGAARLAAYVSEREAADLTARLAALTALPPATRRTECRKQLEGLRVAEDVVVLSEVHPAWILQILEQESPLVTGVLLRSLPSRHVRYLMEHLSAAVKQRLPKLLDTFAVPPAILRIVRRKFEAHFVPMRQPRPEGRFRFRDVCHLRAEELETLLHDVGIHELALALREMDRKGIQIILNRLPFAEAKALKERIESATVADPLLERDAKYTVFDFTIDQAGGSMVLTEVGVHAVAKACGPAENAVVRILRQKLPPRLGGLLIRCVDTYVRQVHRGVVERRQSLILRRLAALSAAGSVDRQWRYLLPADDAAGPGIGEATATHFIGVAEGQPDVEPGVEM